VQQTKQIIHTDIKKRKIINEKLIQNLCCTLTYNEYTGVKLPAISKIYVMTLQEAQNQVDEWIKTVGVRYFSELTNMTILTEEVGELARIMARKYGDQSFKKSDEQHNLADEMADVLWVLICLANQTGVNLTDALHNNFEKKNIRDANRHKENPKLQ